MQHERGLSGSLVKVLAIELGPLHHGGDAPLRLIDLIVGAEHAGDVLASVARFDDVEVVTEPIDALAAEDAEDVALFVVKFCSQRVSLVHMKSERCEQGDVGERNVRTAVPGGASRQNVTRSSRT